MSILWMRWITWQWNRLGHYYYFGHAVRDFPCVMPQNLFVPDSNYVGLQDVDLYSLNEWVLWGLLWEMVLRIWPLLHVSGWFAGFVTYQIHPHCIPLTHETHSALHYLMKSTMLNITSWNPQCLTLPHEIHCAFCYLMKSTMLNITSWNPLRILLSHEIHNA